MRAMTSMTWLCLAVWAGSELASASEPLVRWSANTSWRIRLVSSDEVADEIAEIPPLPTAPPDDDAPIVAKPLTTGPAITLEGPNADLDGDADDEEDEPNPGALLFTYVPGGGDDFGWFGFELRDLPPARMPQASMLTAQPGWGITWLNGPQTNDLPPQLYHIGLTLGGQTEINDDLVLDLAISPMWFTDWENRRPEAFRLMGRGAWYLRIGDNTQAAAGFVYLNRDDIAVLPVAGLIIADEVRGQRYELVFPRPKLSWRLSGSETTSRWFTLGGELGGGSWAIKRPDRKPDVITYRDLRLVAGWEFHGIKGRRAAFEAGWLFGRALESRTGRNDYDPPDAAMLRMVLDY